MTLALILVLAAIASLVVIVRLAVSRSLQVSAGSGHAIQPIDIEAFRNLVDPAEDDFLRRRLPAAAFRRVQRARLRAMSAYIQTALQNAAILIHIGQLALASGDAPTVAAAHELIEQALLLRRNATFALLRIRLAYAWPSTGLAAAPVLARYRQLNGSAMLLGRLQNPSVPVRISA